MFYIKYIKIVLISIVLTIELTTCTEPTTEKAKYQIKNNSNYKIDIELHRQSSEMDSILVIDVDTFISYEINLKVGPPFFEGLHADSVIVIFSDTVEITHNPWETERVSRNIFLEKSWDVEIVNESIKEFEYIFTEDDFIEALEK